MPADSDLLFGKIAVALGFSTQAQVDRCLELQAKAGQPLPLGRHLVEEGYLTEDQHSKVLEVQRRNMLRLDPATKTSREDVLFGKLAVRFRWVTEDQLNECLREQGRPGEERSLGEIMVAKGFVTADQVKGMLAKQSKRIMSCPSCRLSFTVYTTSKEKKAIACPRCKRPLDEGKPTDSTRTDGEFSTQIRLPVLPPDDAGVAAVRPKTEGVTCRICDHPFVGPVDSDGRVECLSCHVRFVPK